MEKTQIEFSTVELFDIMEYIDSAQNGQDLVINMLIVTWNTILRHEGKSLSTVDSLNPTSYAIPEEQWHTINKAAMRRAKEIGLSEIGVSNVGLEFMNLGPSNYKPFYAITDQEDPRHPLNS